jgi:excisionase family DNA binding protein
MPEKIPAPVFLSAPKAATLCGVSRNTVCCWIREGKLPSYRTAGGKNLIRPSDLLMFMRANSMFVPQDLVDLAQSDDQKQQNDDEKTTNVEPAVLVVDDDKDARAMAVMSLKDLGLPILEASTGYEALHLLVQHPEVALVVLDLVMPGQHGSDTLKDIRKRDDRLPVIVVSGFASDGHEDVFAEIQPDLIITKPYDPKDLKQAAQAYLADLGL